MKTIYVTRHSFRVDDRRGDRERSRNWKDRDSVWFDPPLNPVRSIPQLAEETKKIEKIDRCYSSPFQRCLQTADYHCYVHNCNMVVEYSLGEMLLSSWFERKPDLSAYDLSNPNGRDFMYYNHSREYESFFPIDDYKIGESRRGVRKRITRFCNFLVEDMEEGQYVLLVSHGFPSKYILNHFGIKSGHTQMGVVHTIKV